MNNNMSRFAQEIKSLTVDVKEFFNFFWNFCAVSEVGFTEAKGRLQPGQKLVEGPKNEAFYRNISDPITTWTVQLSMMMQILSFIFWNKLTLDLPKKNYGDKSEQCQGVNWILRFIKFAKFLTGPSPRHVVQ